MRAVLVALAYLLAMPALADEGPGIISTQATAHVRLPNTVADVAVAVEAQGSTLPAVQQSLTAGADQLLAYLRGQSVDRLVTGSASVGPQVAYVQGKPNKVVGYTGRVRVTFRVPAGRLGAVLAGALENGGNSLEDTSLHPTEDEVETTQRRLASDAVRTALAQARAVAEAAGRRLGAVRAIEVGADNGGNFGRPAPMMLRAAAAAPAPAPPIATEAGESEVSATVSVKVALVEP